MSEYIENVSSQPSGLDWAVSFNRKSASPLDKSSLFSSLEDAINYAKGNGSDSRGIGSTSYVGQIITVLELINPRNIERGYDLDAYVIQSDRTLLRLQYEGEINLTNYATKNYVQEYVDQNASSGGGETTLPDILIIDGQDAEFAINSNPD